MNKFKLVIFCVFLVFSFNKATEQDKDETIDTPDFNEVPAIHLKKTNELQKLLDETDMTYFVYYYKKSSLNSRRGVQFLIEISKKLQYLAQLVLVDCDVIEPSDTSMCKQDSDEDLFPKMEVHVPPEYKVNPYTKKANTHYRRVYDNTKVSEVLLYNFITQNIPARSVKLNLENFENFVTQLDFNKVILFTDKAKTPLLFRGISNYFYDRILFGEVHKDQEGLIKKFKVQKFPTLLIYHMYEDGIPLDEPKLEIFTKQPKAADIVEFIEPYAYKEPFGKMNKNERKSQSKSHATFKQFNKTELITYMNKFSQKKFVILANDKAEIPNDLLKVNMNTNGFFSFININCKSDQETEKFCLDTFKIAEVPSIIMYKNTQLAVKERLEKGGISLPLDYLGIEKELYKQFSGNLKEGNPQTFSSILYESRINKKLPFVYLHEGEIPLGLFLISTEEKYLKYVDFILYENPPKQFLHNTQVKKLPKLIILLQNEEKPESARVISYNDEVDYLRLGSFINNYITSDKEQTVSHDEDLEKKEISLLNNKERLTQNCLKGKKVCVIGFLDARTNEDSLKQFDNSFKILEKVELDSRKKNKPANFAWVNATCQTELAQTFNINLESLPNLITYVPSKNVFANLIGTFDEETILSFIDRTMQGKVPLKTINADKFVFQDIQCENLKDYIETSDDDDILKEIIEEERKKREEFEKERENLEGKKKKKKKKKKKSDL